MSRRPGDLADERDAIVETIVAPPDRPPTRASVVVVLYRTDRTAVEELLDALDGQTVADFELIVVNNGTTWDATDVVRATSVSTVYAELAKNFGVTTGRNVGAELARGELLIFLDDDALPHEEFVQRHLEAHSTGIVAARGRVYPKGDYFYNRLQDHYDLGDESLPFLLNTEGNLSVETEAFHEVGGFDEWLDGRAGHEGVLLTRALLRAGVPRDDIIYYPEAIIYHDYSESLSEYVRKETDRIRTEQTLRERHPELSSFIESYDLDEWTTSLTLGERVRAAVLQAVVWATRHLFV